MTPPCWARGSGASCWSTWSVTGTSPATRNKATAIRSACCYPSPPAALGRLNADVQGAATHTSLVPVKSGFEWSFDDLREFDSVLWPIARAAGDLLASDQLRYVRACHSKTCEWFFLDTSKNHHRRWCDMTRCGNRAKVRRFYVRQKKASS